RATRCSFETSIPSSTMANSLARSSMLRIPSWGRGNLNTPFSSRLYHSTKPSRSHTRIFNRSPRRERNTNRCPLSGFSPITACTRSASRSNPQRMSVASTASQMRAACAPSSARKLGSPITPLPPRPPAPALAQHHSLAPPPGSARSATVSRPARHRTRAALAHGPPPRTRSRPARRGGPAALPRTCLRRHASPLLRHCACSLAKPPPAAASSTSKSVARTTDAPGRTPPHSARSAPARQPASATSLAPSCSVLAASLCLPPRHPAQCSTPPRPHKMPFTYRSRSSTEWCHIALTEVLRRSRERWCLASRLPEHRPLGTVRISTDSLVARFETLFPLLERLELRRLSRYRSWLSRALVLPCKHLVPSYR